jgi:hypothetical protein
MNVRFPPLSPRLRVIAMIVAPFLVLAVIFAVWWNTGQEPIPPRTVMSGALPAGMPTHFSFGVESGLHGTTDLNAMRTGNGTAWEARYQYLAAGVNTGAGWQTWEQPGQFATLYLQESQQNDYLPAFVYYMLLQSNGPSGDGSENGKDLAHLADPGVMKAYYADWTQLMRDIGRYGKPTLVVVEPDLWGYIEQAAANHFNDAASVPASVASSGNADLAGYSDNAAGFARALLHLRDKYAPNAILTLHVSIWGTGTDLGRDMNDSLDVATLARRQASFLSTAGLQAVNGVSTFDLLSIDVADRDAGETGVWWDPTNKAPNSFNRFLRYTATLSSETQRRIVLWQVPIGNQVYQTENNTQGHYQDNKAQYILGHVADFVRAGVVMTLFGAGGIEGSHVNDAHGDGITNPAPVSSFQCDRCNKQKSEYADDDGGYLRLTVGQYYKNGPYPLPGDDFQPTAP